MNNETIKIKKENILATYTKACKVKDTNCMEFLESLFGKDMFKPKDITERVKTFDDACQELGESDEVLAYNDWINTGNDTLVNKDITAYMKLRIICAALNEGWKPQFTIDEYRYFPWFYLYTEKEIENMDDEGIQSLFKLPSTSDYGGVACANAGSDSSYTSSSRGSRLAFKSKELAKYAGKQFIDIWADYIL